MVNSENRKITPRALPPPPTSFLQKLLPPQNLPIWFVDLSETGSWTYAETGSWTYAETGSWTYAETGSWTYAETGSWTYRKPVRARRQKVQLVLVRLAYGQPH